MRRLLLAAVVALALGCTPLARRQAVVIAADTARCVLEHLDLPSERVALVCGVTAAERAVMDLLLAEGRRQTARAAAEASSRVGCPPAAPP